ncbi:MAG: flippase-like domain-containing protein [Solirubrobacterales bacterium]|nr:flippase-like domain-containing protein [Solirubrobacterales bacterium]
MIFRTTAMRALRWKRGGTLVAVAVAFLAVPPLAHVPARLVTACAKWIALAAALELLSMLGFVLVFALIFGARLRPRERLGAGFRALGAITVLPAGGLVGPAVAARAAAAEATPLPVLTRSTVALTILTNAPGLLILGGLGIALWLGWPPGPHNALLTLPEAGVALAIVAGVWMIARASPSRRAQPRFERGRRLIAAAAHCRDGASEARRLVTEGNWKLAGALGYYAFDNAVLWAAFHAYGRTPAISVIVMGYLVGSLGTVLPLPAGIGGVEGGLIGALVLYGAPAVPASGAVLLYRGVSLSLPVALGGLAWGLIPAHRLRSPRRRPLRAGLIRPRASEPASAPSNDLCEST